MITRKNNINLDSAEVSFTISYTCFDVWQWLHRMACFLHQDDKEMFDFAFNLVMSESDVVYTLTHDPKSLGWMSQKHAEPIARWAVNIAIKQDYLIREGTKFLLSRKLAKKNKRNQEGEE
jgi:hypothetical protein